MICGKLNNCSTNNLILTVNQRLSIELQRQQQAQQQNLGKTAWNTPCIMPINTWIQTLWDQYSTGNKIRISSYQELCIWQDIIQNDAAFTLLHGEQTAALAQQAWQIIQLWQLDNQLLKNAANFETQKFYNWAIQFESICQQKNLLSPSQVLNLTTDLFQQQLIPLPAAIHLIGFDQYSPALHSLIQCLQQKIPVEDIAINKKAQPVKRYEFINEEDEIQQIALWAKSELNLNKKTNIACIFPRLSEQRTKIARIFHETFYTSLDATQNTPLEPLAFNISAAQPLTHYPIIQTAAQILGLCCGPVNIEQMSYLLQSPYLATHITDLDLGSLIDFQLRELDEINLCIRDVITVLMTLKPATAFKQWIMRWHTLNVTINQLPSQQPASLWANSFRQLLATLGWPGQRPLNSQEYQLCEKINNCLQEFTAIDVIYPQLTLNKAIKLLLKLLTQTTFQAEGSVAPVQILGILESSSLGFEKIWIANLDDEQWPPAAKPNPFLPIELQRQHQTPHSSAERELNFCKSAMQRLFNSAEDVFVSSYQLDDDQQKQPSQLIKNIELNVLENLALSSRDLLLTQYPNHNRMEYITDTNGLPNISDGITPGGSHLLKLQALCPFRAFSQIRLKVAPINAPGLGLKPTQRGILTHQILENIWQHLQDSATLQTTPPAVLQQLIEQQVTTALEDFKLASYHKTNKIFYKTEQQRLTRIISQWLDYEKQRSPFKVLACEERLELTLGDLNLNLRLDRIDELADGRKIIIDYKTSQTTINSWLQDALLEPQLPLYCIDKLNNNAVDGLVFAQIQPANIRFKGIINDGNHTEKQLDITNCSDLKIPEAHNWTQLAARWQQQLTALSHDFCQGNALRKPTSPMACQTCHLHAFCRIFET